MYFQRDELSLKPYRDPEHPSIRWMVSGPSREAGRRWRRLFETKDEANTFLRDYRDRKRIEAQESGGANDAGKGHAPVAKSRSKGKQKSDLSGRSSRQKMSFAWLWYVAWAGGLGLLVWLGFQADLLIARARVPVKKPFIRELQADFFSEPKLEDWSPTGPTAVWLQSDVPNDNCLRIAADGWESANLPMKERQWYQLSFRSRTSSPELNPDNTGGSAFGKYTVSFFDTDGKPLARQWQGSVFPSGDWLETTITFRAVPFIDASGNLAYGKMRISFTSISGHHFDVDDVTVEAIGEGVIAYLQDKYFKKLPVRITYRPKASRLLRLPATLDKLRRGGDVKMLFVGDAIQEELANSHLDVLIARHYPKSRIQVIPSIRPDSGVGYFKAHVEEYITRYRPDLVVIGGVSNEDNMVDYQELINAITKAHRSPDEKMEIMLLTKGWIPNAGGGNAFISAPELKELDQIPGNNAVVPDDYRGRLMQLAAKNRLEFFDLHGALNDFFRGSADIYGYGFPKGPNGKPYDFWHRDWAHPNERGRETLARILEAYFAPPK